jgi:cytidylate kinase
MARRVICISSEPGAGGERIGRRVAEQLELRFIDEQIVVRAAVEAHLSPDDLLDVERRKPVLERLFSGRRESTLLGDASPGGDELNRAVVRAAVRAVAEEGDAVIHAHAASIALGAQPGVLRILVTASPETRERRVAAERQTSEREARRLLRDEERGRADYLRTFYDVERELPTHYDLVVNTDALGEDEAVALITAAASL